MTYWKRGRKTENVLLEDVQRPSYFLYTTKFYSWVRLLITNINVFALLQLIYFLLYSTQLQSSQTLDNKIGRLGVISITKLNLYF